MNTSTAQNLGIIIFSIAYAAMNAILRTIHAPTCFSIAYAAMNAMRI